MKLSISILTALLAQQAAAFSPQAGYLQSLSSLNVAANPVAIEEGAGSVQAAPAAPVAAVMDVETDFNLEEKPDPRILDPTYRVQTGRYNSREMSVSVPFLKRPGKLDGSHAGDVGFDPLGFSEDNDMYVMMEAELRHSRLAMLAVIGWPLSELNAPNFMLHGKQHLAPSVLNGFDPVSFLGFAAIFGAIGYFEFQTAFRRVDNTKLGKIHAEDMANVWQYGVPGDYNFDPLNLYNLLGDSADARKAMREAEVAHGRGAMMGITYFAAWEALTGHPIVENSVFFHPNAVLPFAAFTYFLFGFFYEIENDGQFMFQARMTSEGAVNAARLGKLGEQLLEEATEVATKASATFNDVATIVGYTTKDLNTKYEAAVETYTKSSMKNYP